MDKKNIELEFRSEINIRDFDNFLTLLRETSLKSTYVKRLSIMFLGKILEKNFDIRIRIDSNGKTELVVKKGDFHSHDREEFSQKVKKEQIVGLVRIFSLFGFSSKITERENFDFIMEDDLKVTAVRAKKICYLEFEKMSSGEHVDEDRIQVCSFMNKIGVVPIDKEHFDNLCLRLSRDSDIIFSASDSEFLNLENMLENY